MISNYIQNWLDIIENMSNENTYKLAWGRAILETIGEKEINTYTSIHFDEISQKIIKYYWNQIYFFNLTQGNNKKPYIEQLVNKMIKEYQEAKNDRIPVWYEKAEAYFKENKTSYEHKIRTVSKILTHDVSWRFMNVFKTTLPIYVLDKENLKIYFTKEQATELNDYKFVLSQLLNYRWAQLLEMFNNAPKIAQKVNGISDNKLRRNNLKKYRDILLNALDDSPIDFYTGKVLEVNDISVDHVIPWSFIYSDDIWNLVLTSKTNNSSKSNSIPSKKSIERLKQRNLELINLIGNSHQEEKLKEAIENNYVDKFYNAMKM